MNRDEALHVAIRDEALAMARDKARQAWPAASEALIAQIVAHGLLAAALQAQAAHAYRQPREGE